MKEGRRVDLPLSGPGPALSRSRGVSQPRGPTGRGSAPGGARGCPVRTRSAGRAELMELLQHRRALGSADGLKKFCHAPLAALQRFLLLQRQLRTRKELSLLSSCHEIGSSSSHGFTADTAAPEMIRVIDPAVSLPPFQPCLGKVPSKAHHRISAMVPKRYRDAFQASSFMARDAVAYDFWGFGFPH